MLLYERFTAPASADTVSADTAGPIAAKDVITSGTVVLFRATVPTGATAARLEEAWRIFERWAARHQEAQPWTELFTLPGAMWLTASNEAEVADLLAELRAHGLFENPRVQAAPPPPPMPSPPPKGCASCGKTPLPGKLHCAACAAKVKAPSGPRTRRRRLAWALVAALAATLLLVWWATFDVREPAEPKTAPIVQFTASRTRVRRGGTVVLKWQTSGLGSLTIAPGIGAVGPYGNRTVVMNQDTTFTLRSADRDAPPPASVTVKIVRATASQPVSP